MSGQSSWLSADAVLDSARRAAVVVHVVRVQSDDFLDRFHETAQQRWAELGGPAAAIEMAAETQEMEIGTEAAARPPYLGASA